MVIVSQRLHFLEFVLFLLFQVLFAIYYALAVLSTVLSAEAVMFLQVTACSVGKLKKGGGGGDDLNILMVAAVILKKESWTSDKLWSSIWGVF